MALLMMIVAGSRAVLGRLQRPDVERHRRSAARGNDGRREGGDDVRHVAIIVGMALTCLLAAVANVVAARVVGVNLFTLKFWLLIPVGAAAVGLVAASGGILAARIFHAVPTWLDAVAMVVCAAVAMWLIYYLDYATMVLDDGRRVSSLVSFDKFFEIVTTKAHMRVGRAATDTGAVGDFGYVLAGVEFLGFLLGGIGAFFILQAMKRCGDCGAYLRKMKLKKTPELT